MSIESYAALAFHWLMLLFIVLIIWLFGVWCGMDLMIDYAVDVIISKKIIEQKKKVTGGKE